MKEDKAMVWIQVFQVKQWYPLVEPRGGGGEKPLSHISFNFMQFS